MAMGQDPSPTWCYHDQFLFFLKAHPSQLGCVGVKDIETSVRCPPIVISTLDGAAEAGDDPGSLRFPFSLMHLLSQLSFKAGVFSGTFAWAFLSCVSVAALNT